MTPDEITTLTTGLGGAAAAIGSYGYRFLSKAGRTIRTQRNKIEKAVECITATRLAAVAAGVKPKDLPKIPGVLGLSEGDEDDD